MAYALYTPRRVTFPLQEKVNTELARKEKVGVILRVVMPTACCAGMIAVPKRSGAARTSTDLKPLNEKVLSKKCILSQEWTIL